jgi:hypothetical protein
VEAKSDLHTGTLVASLSFRLYENEASRLEDASPFFCFISTCKKLVKQIEYHAIKTKQSF